MITSILQLSDEHVVSDYSNSIIKSFENAFLPFRFGINSVIKVDIIHNCTTEMAKKLFDLNENLFLICNGTYVCHKKITNNEYQRESYSGQKKVPLCKPFSECTTDGYIIEMLEPYYTKENYAGIF